MKLREKLNQKGLRLTRPRRVVLSILEDSSVPLSPQTLHQRSLEAHEDIGLVTVYRTLDLLTDFNLVRRVHGHEDCQGYVLATPGHHHHLVCQSCDKTVEFTGTDDLTNLVDRIKQQTGFEINEHLLQLYGRCPKCQMKEKEK